MKYNLLSYRYGITCVLVVVKAALIHDLKIKVAVLFGMTRHRYFPPD